MGAVVGRRAIYSAIHKTHVAMCVIFNQKKAPEFLMPFKPLIIC